MLSFFSNSQVSFDQFSLSSDGQQTFTQSGYTSDFTMTQNVQMWNYTFTVDPEEKKVVSFTASYNYDDGDLINVFYASGIDIPLFFSSTGHIHFEIEGPEICNLLTEVEHDHHNLGTGYTKELVDIICEPPYNNYIRIQMVD